MILAQMTNSVISKNRYDFVLFDKEQRGFRQYNVRTNNTEVPYLVLSRINNRDYASVFPSSITTIGENLL